MSNIGDGGMDMGNEVVFDKVGKFSYLGDMLNAEGGGGDSCDSKGEKWVEQIQGGSFFNF